MILSKINILKQIRKELESNKFKEFQLSIDLLSKEINLTPKNLNIILNGYPKIMTKTFDIKNAIKFCKPNIIYYLLENHYIKEKDYLLDELLNLSLDNNRIDNLYILVQYFQKSKPIFNEFDCINKNLYSIEGLLLKKNDNIEFGLEQMWKNELKDLLNSFTIGFLKLPTINMYLPHFVIKSENLWAFDCLGKYYDDLFFLDDELKTCFDYLKPNINIGSISFEDLNTIVNCFGNKYDKILKIIEIFTKNLQNDLFNCEEEYIKYLFSSFPETLYESYNENDNSLFHIVSNIKINSLGCKLIFEKLKNIKKKNFQEFKYLINKQNANGDTFLMKLMQNENYELSIEILNEFYEEINLNLCNRLGNSILHSLLLDKNFGKIYDDFPTYEKIHQLLIKILTKNKNLILLKNREHNTPFDLAAISGCNIALRVILEFYNIEYLENLLEDSYILHLACMNENINTVRFLIEYAHYEPNKKLKKKAKKNLRKIPECSTPLHCAAYASSLEIFEYLLLHGSDPFIENIYEMDALDIAYKYGNYNFLKYIFNLKSSKLYSSNDKYLLSIVQNTQKGACEILDNYIKINTFQNYSIVDKDMNTLLILSCRANNPELISMLINNGIDPLIKNKFGNTCLHISTYINSFTCAGIILSKLESNNEFEKIEQILNIKNHFGNTPLHIAAENNLEEITILFISYLIRNNIKLKMEKNSAGLTPLQLSIKNHNYKIAIFYIKYLDLNTSEILKLKNINISKEVDDFRNCYDSGLLIEYEKYYNEKVSNIKYFIKQRNTAPKKEKENYLEEIKILKGINYNIMNKNILIKSYDFLTYNISKYYKGELLTEELYYNQKSILGNIHVILTLIKWAKNSKEVYIDIYLQF